MPDPKPNESQSDWMARCIPDTMDEGYPQKQAEAICFSKYERKELGGINVSEDEKMYDVNTATSFAELDEMRKAGEQIHDMMEMTSDFNMLSANIMQSPFVEDKAATLRALAKEFSSRIAEENSMEDGEKAVWSTAFINDLPDSSFLYIGTGGEKDGEGKTTPRSLRKFPYKDKNGKVDLPHLRNAIARIPQATGISAAEKRQLQEKARGILEKQGSSGEKTLLETIKGWFDDLKSTIIGKIDIGTEEKQVAFKTVKGVDGKPWIVLWTTNAFQDREKEIFTTKSIDDFIERHRDDDVKGQFWFWHLPNSKFGDIKLQARVGRFLVEAGPFDDTAVGRAFKEFFEKYPDGHPTIAPKGWGASHGYIYDKKDREDSIYEWFEKKESSVLPQDVASNPHNPSMTIKEVNSLMNEKQRKAWNDAFGSEFVDSILQTGETKTVELEESNVEFKGEQVEPVVEEVAEVQVEQSVEEVKEEKVEEVVEEVVEEPETPQADEKEVQEEPREPPITRQELAEALKMVVQELTERFEKKISDEIETTVDAMVEVITPLSTQIKALSQTDEQKIAVQAQSVPTASLTAMVKENLFGNETRIDGRSSLAKDGPEEVAEDNPNGPVIAGTRIKLWN